MFSFLTGTELRRFRRGRLPKLAIVAMICIPLLYGALYLWAYWDPTGNLDRLPVALVNADTGATDQDGAALTAGDDVVDELIASDALDWRQTDAADAAAGVKDGSYYFAVTIPAEFSTDIASAGGADPTPAQLQVTYNDANSYLASTLGRSAMTQIRAAVSATIGEQAVDQVLVGLGSARDGFAQASDGALTLNAASGQLSGAAQQLSDGASTAADGAADLSSGASTLADGTAQLSTGTHQLSQGAAQLSTGIGTAATGAGTLAEKSAELASGASTLSTASGDLAAGASRVSDGVDQLATTLTPVAAALPGLSTELTNLGSQLLTMAAQAEAGGDTATATALRAAVTDLHTQAAPLTEATLDPTALTTLVDGAHQVRDGAATLSSGAGTLSTGATELSAGARQIADGTAQAATAAATLAHGVSTLDGKVGTLDSGAQTLANGAGTLAEGTGTLADGTAQLADGSTQLTDGSQQLADSLAEGAAQLPDDDDSTRGQRAETIATPVQTEDTDIASSATMGEGFAPFFIPLALFVGGLITWLLLRPLPTRALAAPVPGWRIALSGYAPAVLIGVAQVAVLLAVVHLGLGLSWSTTVGTFAFTVLIAAAFLAVQQMLTAVLGSAAGKVAIIALLMIQLTSASGTYPVETTPQIFQTLHPYLPMTYAITGLRELFTGGTEGRLWLSVAALLAFTIGSLAVTSWRAGRMRTWTLDRLHPALSI
ncbi:YhgE/Pip domain-containing protein [Cellulomonas sp. NPDC089187]|uniref:YhgE/Pip domain-containing protein n=1 Tax=Cellulomonas sp. NPDC089187 TaxID=3154970 RepID=UPI003444C296